MNSPSQNPSDKHPLPEDSGKSREPTAGQGGLGSCLLFFGAAIAFLVVVDRTAGLPFKMPDSWYDSQVLWYIMALGSFLAGIKLSKSTPETSGSWKPSLPGQRFETLVVYSREDCHLCNQAKDVLWGYRAWLPEIHEVDIDRDSALREQFSNHIPVVVIDGQIRFRGRVNEVLLRRLIEASPPKKRQ